MGSPWKVNPLKSAQENGWKNTGKDDGGRRELKIFKEASFTTYQNLKSRFMGIKCKFHMDKIHTQTHINVYMKYEKDHFNSIKKYMHMIGNLGWQLRVTVPAEMSGFKYQSHQHMLIERTCTHLLISVYISSVSSSIKCTSNTTCHANLQG